jgi:hypothetical protein
MEKRRTHTSINLSQKAWELLKNDHFFDRNKKSTNKNLSEYINKLIIDDMMTNNKYDKTILMLEKNKLKSLTKERDVLNSKIDIQGDILRKINLNLNGG